MAKKSFKDNPALNFISPPAAPVPRAPRPARAPAPSAARIPWKTAVPIPATEPTLKPNPLYVETKSRRVQLLMQPSLHEKLKAAAAERGQSLNDLIHTVLAEWAARDN